MIPTKQAAQQAKQASTAVGTGKCLYNQWRFSITYGGHPHSRYSLLRSGPSSISPEESRSKSQRRWNLKTTSMHDWMQKESDALAKMGGKLDQDFPRGGISPSRQVHADQSSTTSRMVLRREWRVQRCQRPAMSIGRRRSRRRSIQPLFLRNNWMKHNLTCSNQTENTVS